MIAATENDSVYAISRATGKTVWRAHVGTPVPQSALHGCGDIFPLGITGTPIYDQGDGLVYAVAETTGYQHVLFGLSAADGKVEVRRDLDQPTEANQPAWNQQRPALAIDDGRVYAAFGGLAGDCGAYLGGVVGVALNGRGPLVSWHTPTSREGAVWGTGGPVVEPNGGLWVSNGNGAAGPGDPYDGSDSVTALSPVLHRNGYFAPASWAADNASDLDLGSTEPVIAAGDPTTAFIVGKRGVGYLLSTAAPRRDRARAWRRSSLPGLRRHRDQRVHGLRALPERRHGRRLRQRGRAEDRHSLARARPTATGRRSSAAARPGSPPTTPTAATAAPCTS